MSDHDVLTGWDELFIDDMNDIPDKYLVSWKFFNAFFKAFQERAYYISGVPRPKEYDSLMLDGPLIGRSELGQRLNRFNGHIRTHFASLIGGQFGAIPWLRETTWNDYGSLDSALEDDLPEDEGWTLTDLRALITDDIYDAMLGNDYTFEINFNPLYWSGLYKLLTQVMIYHKMDISTDLEEVGLDPDQISPELVCNGKETFSGTSSDAEALIAESIAEAIQFDTGTTFITNGRISVDSKANRTELLSENALVTYDGMTLDPFFRTPTAMEIRIRLFIGTGHLISVQDSQDKTNAVTYNSELTETTTPPAASHTVVTDETVEISNVYIPDQISFESFRYQNLNLPVTFDEVTGINTVAILDVSDLRFDYVIDLTPADIVQENPENTNFNVKIRNEIQKFQLNEVLYKIPIDDLVYGIQVQA